MKETKSKMIKAQYANYGRNCKTSIYEAYDKPSQNKIKAWEYCKGLCKELNGKDLKVLGANTYKFSAGFIGTYECEEVFVYITDTNNYYIKLKDIRIKNEKDI